MMQPRSPRRFLGICTAGLQPAALQFLREDLASFRSHVVDQGFITFSAADDVRHIRALPYLNNCFLIGLQHQNDKDVSPGDALRVVLEDPRLVPFLRTSLTPGERSFRLILSHANRTVSCDQALMRHAESFISKHAGANVRRAGADAEFWVIIRREGAVYFAKRIGSRRENDRDLAKGELNPEIAYTLCRLSEPSKDDVFLDPFAGSGAIPLARARWPLRLVFATDTDEDMVKSLRTKVKAVGKKLTRARKRFIVRTDDARRFVRFDDGFVTKIVTDPPWGLFDTSIDDITQFYRDVFSEAARVLAKNGLFVVLTSQKETVDSFIAGNPGLFMLQERYDILVSGQKAAIFKFRRL